MLNKIRQWFQPKHLKVDWESLPEWANWVAMDKVKYGECEIACYEQKPYLLNDEPNWFASEGDYEVIGYERDNKKLMANWKNSLQQRPVRK